MKQSWHNPRRSERFDQAGDLLSIYADPGATPSNRTSWARGLVSGSDSPSRPDEFAVERGIALDSVQARITELMRDE